MRRRSAHAARPAPARTSGRGPVTSVRADSIAARSSSSSSPLAAPALGEVRSQRVLDLPDGSRWSATVFTLAEVERLMDLWATTGEALGGRYFWCSDGLIVREPGVSVMVEVLTGLLGSGDFRQVLRQIDDLE